MSMLLAGDIGGTKTTLAVFSVRGNTERLLAEATFHSADYKSLEALVREFLDRNHISVKYASFGVAGPVIEGRVKITNLPWAIEENALRERLDISDVCLVNDIEAIATSVPFLKQSDLQTVNVGEPDSRGCFAVIAPGTGLGEAFAVWEGSRYVVHPSEGGHADFAPANQSQIEILQFLSKEFDHISYELVCSGIGIRNVHSFFRKKGLAESAHWRAKELAADDPVPLIVDSALAKDSQCESCIATLDTFVSILGAAAGNLALTVMATRGVYIGGGIPPRIVPMFKNGLFMEAFRRKGRLAPVLARMPVYIILNPKVALLGAARNGIERLRRRWELSEKVRRS